jgi:hypothetical protein
MLKLEHGLLEEVVDVGSNSFLKDKFIFSIFVEIYYYYGFFFNRIDFFGIGIITFSVIIFL